MVAVFQGLLFPGSIHHFIYQPVAKVIKQRLMEVLRRDLLKFILCEVFLDVFMQQKPELFISKLNLFDFTFLFELEKLLLKAKFKFFHACK